jgi:lipoprotein-anchoring transpeptidase ErfK/SrfK
MRHEWKVLALALVCAGCIEFKDKKAQKSDTAAAATNVAQNVADSNDVSAPSYDAYALDTAGVGSHYTSTPAEDSAYSQINPKTAGLGATKFPAKVPKRGPLALQLQVMLDRAHFSPGIIDGVWGDNAVKALYYFRNPTGGDSAASPTDSASSIDQATYQKLKAAMGSQQVLTRYTVTSDDVKGPFKDIPNNVYEQAKLDCLCYANAAEGLAEKFHTSQKLLAQLNPKVTLTNLTAGTQLTVPNVDIEQVPGSSTGSDSSAASSSTPTSAGTGQIAKLVISRKGYWTHAVDASGNILYHFPSTLGAGYDPSPSGDFKVTSISWNPAFHYQPTLFAEVSDTKPEAHLPKGPNSPVGVVWMALSKPHYGIHGTSTPETIGYANSHGCVRLTNWDATELGKLISKGVAVQFM